MHLLKTWLLTRILQHPRLFVLVNYPLFFLEPTSLIIYSIDWTYRVDHEYFVEKAHNRL